MVILETDGPAALITLDRIEARDAVDRPEADPALRAVVLRGAGPVLRAGMDLAPEVFNRAAPDAGNMGVLARDGTPEQQERWLRSLLAGEIRSSFATTEPEAGSSDARNIESTIRRDGGADVVSGREWRMTGATGPRCRIVSS